MILNNEGVEKTLTAWLNQVARYYKAEGLVVENDGSLASLVVKELASRTKLPVHFVQLNNFEEIRKSLDRLTSGNLPETISMKAYTERELGLKDLSLGYIADSNNSIVLGLQHRDSYEVEHKNTKRGGAGVDAMPLVKLHFSEIVELAKYFNVFDENKLEDFSKQERAIRLGDSFENSTKANDLNHLATKLQKNQLADEETIAVLKELAEKESISVRRHNANIPAPRDLRDMGNGLVS